MLVSLVRLEPQLEHPEEGFAEDAARHLACAQLSVDEDHRDFLNPEAQSEGCVLHLDLEGIALEAYVVQADGFQHLACPADKTGCGVAKLDAKHRADVGRGVVAKILKIGLHIYRAVKIGAISFENIGDVLGRICFTLLSDKTPE